MRTLPKNASQYAVNQPGAREGIYAPLYDFQKYDKAGQTSLTFFQTPNGSGGKTLADTNMTNAGVLPAPQYFVVNTIEVIFYPGASPAEGGLTSATVNEFVNDVYAVSKSGYLEFTIGSKPYTQDAPLGMFPPCTRLGGFAALTDATTAAANLLTQVSYASAAGATYNIVPLTIPTQQNFSVKLSWPSVVALPSGVDGRIGVRLGGFLYRSVQ